MNTAQASVFNPALNRRVLLLAGLAFALWASWKVSTDDAVDATVAPRTAATQLRVAKPTAASPASALDWPVREAQQRPVADLFSLPLPPSTASATPIAPVATPLPVLTVKYVGRIEGDDNQQVFLTDSKDKNKDKVMSVKVGQAVADGWQLAAMDSKQLVFRHIATGHEQTMPIGTPP